jgi:hypothetical protein
MAGAIAQLPNFGTVYLLLLFRVSKFPADLARGAAPAVSRAGSGGRSLGRRGRRAGEARGAGRSGRRRRSRSLGVLGAPLRRASLGGLTVCCRSCGRPERLPDLDLPCHHWTLARECTRIRATPSRSAVRLDVGRQLVCRRPDRGIRPEAHKVPPYIVLGPGGSSRGDVA